VPSFHAAGFLSAVLRLPDNPLALREWRGLQHQARDWRLWLGLRIPKDARGWGLPAIAWFFLAPYIVWGALSLGRRVAPAYFDFTGGPTVDILALCFGMLALYPAVAAAALMAGAVSRERERETWDALRSTMASPDDILVGLLAGRLGPVLLSYGAVGAFWIAALPHYAPLMRSFTPFTWSAAQLAMVVAASLALCAAVGTLSLAASVALRQTGAATTVSMVAAILLGSAVTAALVLAPGMPGLLIALGVMLPVTLLSYAAARQRMA
jgi:hypothetical protein